jgi:pimeloyl-ACP methyl ester carboxylesterase
MAYRQRMVGFGALLAVLLLAGCPKKSPPPAPAVDVDPDPRWAVQQKPRAKVALVFVHGVTGDMLGTWTAPNGKKFWDLVDENQRLSKRTDAFVFGFPSYFIKDGSFDIDQAAIRLHQRIKDGGVLDYPAVVFVAHSMGGLVVMRELLAHREILEKVPVVMFYATPMEGSFAADVGRYLLPNTALGQMTDAQGNALLRIIDTDWKSIPDQTRPKVRCAYENKPVGPITVVRWASATRYCDGASPAIEGDHMSIVKPERPTSDAIVILANALNDFVLGKQLEPKLETPDFTTLDKTPNVFILRDPFGRQPARLVNAGGGHLRYTFTDISDKSLWLAPEDTPREIPANDKVSMTIGLGLGATRSEYQFTLRTDVDMRVTVRVPDLAAVVAQQQASAVKVGEQINSALTDPRLQPYQQDTAEGQGAVTALVQVAHDELARQSPDVPEATQWMQTADLLNSLNWPTLAVRALQNAERASPAIATTPRARFLAGVAAFQSGDAQVFKTAATPVFKYEDIKEWNIKQPLASGGAATLGENIADKMALYPGLKVFGYSLKGDVEFGKGNPNGAREAYKAAEAIRPTPSVSGRLLSIEQNYLAPRPQAEKVRPPRGGLLKTPAAPTLAVLSGCWDTVTVGNTSTFCVKDGGSLLRKVEFPNSGTQSPPSHCEAGGSIEDQGDTASIRFDKGRCDNGKSLTEDAMTCSKNGQTLQCQRTKDNLALTYRKSE